MRISKHDLIQIIDLIDERLISEIRALKRKGADMTESTYYVPGLRKVRSEHLLQTEERYTKHDKMLCYQVLRREIKHSIDTYFPRGIVANRENSYQYSVAAEQVFCEVREIIWAANQSGSPMRKRSGWRLKSSNSKKAMTTMQNYLRAQVLSFTTNSPTIVAARSSSCPPSGRLLPKEHPLDIRRQSATAFSVADIRNQYADYHPPVLA